MSKSDSLRVLSVFNNYRRGAMTFNQMEFLEVTPLKISEALDCAIEALELDVKLGEPKKDLVYRTKAGR